MNQPITASRAVVGRKYSTPKGHRVEVLGAADQPGFVQVRNDKGSEFPVPDDYALLEISEDEAPAGDQGTDLQALIDGGEATLRLSLSELSDAELDKLPQLDGGDRMFVMVLVEGEHARRGGAVVTPQREDDVVRDVERAQALSDVLRDAKVDDEARIAIEVPSGDGHWVESHWCGGEITRVTKREITVEWSDEDGGVTRTRFDRATGIYVGHTDADLRRVKIAGGPTRDAVGSADPFEDEEPHNEVDDHLIAALERAVIADTDTDTGSTTTATTTTATDTDLDADTDADTDAPPDSGVASDENAATADPDGDVDADADNDGDGIDEDCDDTDADGDADPFDGATTAADRGAKVKDASLDQLSAMLGVDGLQATVIREIERQREALQRIRPPITIKELCRIRELKRTQSRPGVVRAIDEVLAPMRTPTATASTATTPTPTATGDEPMPPGPSKPAALEPDGGEDRPAPAEPAAATVEGGWWAGTIDEVLQYIDGEVTVGRGQHLRLAWQRSVVDANWSPTITSALYEALLDLAWRPIDEFPYWLPCSVRPPPNYVGPAGRLCSRPDPHSVGDEHHHHSGERWLGDQWQAWADGWAAYNDGKVGANPSGGYPNQSLLQQAMGKHWDLGWAAAQKHQVESDQETDASIPDALGDLGRALRALQDLGLHAEITIRTWGFAP